MENNNEQVEKTTLVINQYREKFGSAPNVFALRMGGTPEKEIRDIFNKAIAEGKPLVDDKDLIY
ncbi:MAG: hypothetical protein HN948_05965 [Clostridia bacterium]|jgi:hypothetical protein|nr:hypothetical protein [Clostridia bacterium]MBT7122541.1 hypothetical protein [Clostridia bacterium]